MISRDFLEQLYYSNISPMERSINKHSKLKQIMNVVSDAIEKFNTKLTEEQQKELDKLLCLKTTEACQMEIDAFLYGCRFAFRFLLSCMGDENGDFKIEELLKLDGETI